MQQMKGNRNWLECNKTKVAEVETLGGTTPHRSDR